MIVSCELLPCVLHDRLILQLPRDPASQLYRLRAGERPDITPAYNLPEIGVPDRRQRRHPTASEPSQPHTHAAAGQRGFPCTSRNCRISSAMPPVPRMTKTGQPRRTDSTTSAFDTAPAG